MLKLFHYKIILKNIKKYVVFKQIEIFYLIIKQYSSQVNNIEKYLIYIAS